MSFVATARRISIGKKPGDTAREQAAKDAKAARHSKARGFELGFKPVPGQWSKRRPKARGLYCVISREGGGWTGEVRHSRADWNGYWWPAPLGTPGLDIRRLPPAPSWEPEALATGVDERPQPARTRATK